MKVTAETSEKFKSINNKKLSTDIEWKTEGNKYYSKRDYESAIECYLKSISLNNTVAIHHTNLALSYLQVKRWNEAASASRKAISIDFENLKGHFYLGQALCRLDLLDDAILHFQTAIQIAKSKRVNVGDTLAKELRLVRSKRLTRKENIKQKSQSEFQAYLTRLILDDQDRRLRETAVNCDEESRQIESEIKSLETAANGDEETCQEVDKVESDLESRGTANDNEETRQIKSEIKSRLSSLNALFEKPPREVPDYLCGKISFEILKDPVISPSGITYDREDIVEHIHKIGHFDPITRESLKVSQLITNYAMREAVHAFLSKNEWAIDY